jgi:lipopolysaccharide/colanic/teichoic acid biosynthesis glycosyltransferase
VTPAANRTIKRVIDVVASLVLLVVVLPVLGIVALISLMMQGRPVFYTSKRHVGKDRVVTIYKFRSMAKDATSGAYRLRERFMDKGYLGIPMDCEVYTPLGRFLERTQLVELPQIFNVLLDGMSWVGNRALPAENVEMLKQFPGWEERFESPCGLTGISQVVGKFNLNAEQRIEVERLYSAVYQRGYVLKCDLLIVLATIRLILWDRSMPYEEGIALLESCLPARERRPEGSSQ